MAKKTPARKKAKTAKKAKSKKRSVSTAPRPRKKKSKKLSAAQLTHLDTELGKLRQDIDQLDDEIIERLNRRAQCAISVGKLKAEHSQRAYVPERERAVLDRLVKKSNGPLMPDSLRQIYKEVISASLALESPLDVSFLGPEATFTHEATKRHFGMSARLSARRTIPEVFDDVERDRSDYGVVPIENSTEGVVSHTLDSFVTSDLIISAEVLLSVSHHLLNRNGSIGGITKVYSHPQALAQCRNWLSQNLPGVPLIDVSSTARAAQLAAEDSSAAAIASDLAASMYGLQIASSHLEDLKSNMTRFLVVGTEEAAPTEEDRTSIMFSLKHAPGILYKALAPFGRNDVNLSRIESRPSRKRAWEYLFFVDVDGHRLDPNVTEAIEELADASVFMKVLGSYPRGKLTTRTVGPTARRAAGKRSS
ncbi:MAG: prephenate dehydratase [Myxococcota bacterium]